MAPNTTQMASKTTAKKSDSAVKKPKGEKKKNGYMEFCKESRLEHKADNPDMAPLSLKQLGGLWKELSESEKLSYSE